MTKKTFMTERPPEDERLVFLDLETMGTEPDSPIVEISMIVENPPPAYRSEFNFIVGYSQAEWEQADPAALSMHRANDLYRLSVHRGIGGPSATILEAEREAIHFLEKLRFGSRTAVLAGNSIGMDRVWIATQMPRLHRFLSHRMIDVSTVRQLVARFVDTEISEAVNSLPSAHRGLADCEKAKSELEVYVDQFFSRPSITERMRRHLQ